MEDTTFERLLNLQNYNDAALKDLVKRLSEEERELSRKRRLLHAEIDLVRAELVRRLRDKHASGESLVTEGDLSSLTEILSGLAPRANEILPELHSDEGKAPAKAAGPAEPATPVVGRVSDFSADVREERLVRYITAQVGQGRKLDDILADTYVITIANEVKRAELIQNPHVIRAVQDELKKQFSQYDAGTRPASEKPRSE